MSSANTDLAVAVDSVPGRSVGGLWLRHQTQGWRYSAPGAGARTQGGRWNPPQSFATLYLGESETVVRAELQRLAQRNGLEIADFVPRDLLSYDLQLTDVLDLTGDATQSSLGLSEDDGELSPVDRCQKIGEMANHLGREAILAPSATGAGRTLAVFVERLGPDSRCELVDAVEWTMES